MTHDFQPLVGNLPSGDIDCLLTLVLPLALEEETLDLLRQHTDLVPGFSVVHGQGIGSHAPLTTAMEQVQGRARRVFISMALRRADVEPLVARLRGTLSSAQVFYWVAPLLAYGRLA
jgi:hypothetical protein